MNIHLLIPFMPDELPTDPALLNDLMGRIFGNGENVPILLRSDPWKASPFDPALLDKFALSVQLTGTSTEVE